MYIFLSYEMKNMSLKKAQCQEIMYKSYLKAMKITNTYADMYYITCICCKGNSNILCENRTFKLQSIILYRVAHTTL